MKTYELQILRYHHDAVTGEFANVGIVLYEPTSKTLICRVTHGYKRISNFFHSDFIHQNGHYIQKVIKLFENNINKISEQLSSEIEFRKYKSIEEITSSILPKDDSALRTSEVFKGLSLDFEKSFNDLFERYISKYENVIQRKSRTDDEAWHEVYKKYFDQNGLTKKFEKHTIKTKNDLFEFDYAIKNGSWHLYNPISFDLTDTDNIREKVYKWKGKISELESSNEEFNINFLILYPTYKGAEKEKTFIDKMLKTAAYKSKIQLVDEDKINTHLKKLKEYFKEHK